MLPPASDHFIDAARRLKCHYLESFFFRAALEAGYGLQSETRARELMVIYSDPHRGPKQIPDWVREYAIRVCEGQMIH